MNPRAVPDTWVSLAKQRAQAPPPPPNPPRRKAPSSALAALTILSDVPDLHFARQDGSFRRAPEVWVLPMTTSRVMWEYWFQGCMEPRMGPFRLLKQRDLSTASNRVQISQARGVMKKQQHLVASAVHAEEMPQFKSMAVFEHAYAVLSTPAALAHLSDMLAPDRAAIYPYRHVYELLIKDRHKFPSTTSLVMWMHWFKGDPAHDIGPFRHLRSRDVDRFANDRRPRKLLSSARVLMEKLVDVALDAKLVMSVEDLDDMDEGSVEGVFHEAFARLMADSGVNSSNHGANKMHKYTYTTVYHMMTPSQRKRPRVDHLDDDDAGDNNHHEGVVEDDDDAEPDTAEPALDAYDPDSMIGE
ncbi:hypothetical protein DYB38_008438 [Aphanomyces astaci]|uniref:Uncharacterized protein n=2 Tax=Aphanomyces astaci TaxID=112090 RepID=A0A397CTD6_APHAT|nr:hypothetical protein DYB38_008438 [Aphanomyces astaci]RHY76650.1 hypothetical protein DYB34_002116 [Aphanomyces astaci]